MPTRRTKRGADRTPLRDDSDILVCGASFAGLAIARELAERLPMRVHQAHGAQPLGRNAAGRRLALADLIAVDHQHASTAARKLTCNGEPGKARPADQHVIHPVQRSPLITAFCGSDGHGGQGYPCLQ